MKLALLLTLAACTSSAPPALHGDAQALAYRSRGKVRDADAKQMVAEAAADARRRTPWSESNHLHAPDGVFGDGAEKYLVGEARLHLAEYETAPGSFREVDRRDDAAMALADALFVLDELERWTRRYGVFWDVQLGGVVGRITSAGRDAGVQRMIDELSRRAGQTPAQAEAARESLDAKYRDRR